MKWKGWPHKTQPSHHGDGFLEGGTQEDVGIWWRFRRLKLMPYGTLVALTLLLCSIVIIERQSNVGMLSGVSKVAKTSGSTFCKVESHHHYQRGSEPLPKGIVQETTDLELKPLWIDKKVKEVKVSPTNLLAMAVGIKQKENVDQIVEKFPSDNFTVMLFHYDGAVDDWNDLAWSKNAIHIAVMNQTKWWFAKRFLHPDVVATYNYIFVWDEDIGVKNFHAGRYLTIVEDEGLEISQPALDPYLSEVHHLITVRRIGSKAHRRMYKFKGSGLCFENSTGPPCTGWVEMMVPVFSRAAWRCTWRLIQNDLVHSWGLDKKLGYCAQGDRSRKVGVVDDQYIVHHGIPSLGGSFNKTMEKENTNTTHASTPNSELLTPVHRAVNERAEIRRLSGQEMEIFRQRWIKAVEQDKCWVDPY